MQIFEVEESKPYLFRVISAATLYPFRLYIEGHLIVTIEASDVHDIVKNVHTASTKLVVESFIIYLEERIDFTEHAVQEPSFYLLVAESLEVLDSSLDEYHAAEAILHYAKTPYISNPPKATPNTCTLSKPCITFNCPFLYYPQGANRICWNLDGDAYSKNPEIDFQEVFNVSQTLFFNFGFNGVLKSVTLVLSMDVGLFFQLNQYCTDLTTQLGDVIRQIVDMIPCANALFMKD